MKDIDLNSTKAKLNSGCKCALPRLFREAVGNLAQASIVDEGILITKADPLSDKQKLRICDFRITLPRDMLRLYKNPNIFDISFVDGRQDAILLRPYHCACISCGSFKDLVEVRRYEVYICRSCISKAFNINLSNS